jgi:hypothetical protein
MLNGGKQKVHFYHSRKRKVIIPASSKNGGRKPDSSSVTSIGNLIITPISTYLKNFPFSKMLFDDDSVLSNVKRHLSRIELGSPADLTSPFLKLTSDQLCMPVSRDSMADFTLNLCESSKLVSELPEFLSGERKERSKIGSTSISLPWLFTGDSGVSKQDGARAYFKNPDSKHDPVALEAAFQRICSTLPSELLVPDSLNIAALNSVKSTNWGLPFWKKGNDWYDAHNQIWEKHLEIATLLIECKIPFFKHLAIMAARIQPNGTEQPKQRAVMAFGHYITLIEASYLRPLLNEFRKYEGFEEYVSRSSANVKITQLLRRAGQVPNVGFDGESFDTNVSRVCLNYAYEIVKYLFDSKFHWIIEELKLQNVEADYFTPDGVYSGRVGGVSSGCGLTNIIDSLSQWLMFEYCMQRDGLTLEQIQEAKKIFNGDDGIWSYPGLTTENMVKYCGELNMPVNFDKVNSNPLYIHFCQRYYTLHPDLIDEFGICKDVRYLCRTTNSILNFERFPGFDKTSEFYSVRCIGQLEESFNHPCFNDYVAMLVKSDKKHGLGTAHTYGPAGLIKSIGGITGVKILEKANGWEIERARRIDKGDFFLRVIGTLEAIARA